MSPLTRTLQTAALAFGNEEQPPWNAVELKWEPALMDCAAQNDWIDAAKVDGGYSPISSTHNAQFVANEVRDTRRSIELTPSAVSPFLCTSSRLRGARATVCSKANFFSAFTCSQRIARGFHV